MLKVCSETLYISDVPEFGHLAPGTMPPFFMPHAASRIRYARSEHFHGDPVVQWLKLGRGLGDSIFAFAMLMVLYFVLQDFHANVGRVLFTVCFLMPRSHTYHMFQGLGKLGAVKSHHCHALPI